MWRLNCFVLDLLIKGVSFGKSSSSAKFEPPEMFKLSYLCAIDFALPTMNDVAVLSVFERVMSLFVARFG